MRVVDIRRNTNTFSNYNEAVVVIEELIGGPSNPVEALLDPAVKKLALEKAAQEGISNPALTIHLSHPYPVDAEGRPVTQVGPGAPVVAAYRIDVPVASRF